MPNGSQSELDAEDLNAWNQIWNSLCAMHYSAYFDELCAEHSLTVWRRFDALFKVLQFITAGGSAIAGWSLWHQEGFRWIWAILAGLAVFIAGIHGALSITDKIKEESLNYADFRGLRVRCERLKSHMQVLSYDRLSDYRREYKILTEQFDPVTAKKKPDFLLFRRTEQKIQVELNRSLGL